MLNCFEKASGQKVNMEKSSVFFSKNLISGNKIDILSRLGMREVDVRSMYLGLPSTFSRNKSSIFEYLKDRVRERIQGWDNKIMSRAGKKVLLKTVAEAIPTYTMNVFLLPIQVY